MPSQFTFAAKLSDLKTCGSLSVQVDGHTVALFLYGNNVFAVDNRCPHMGFPLDKGTVKDGILTCYWHYARFDLASGGTFDLWADDVRTFPHELRGDEVWVDVTPHANPRAHYRQRLRDGLERNISLVVAKSAITLLESGEEIAEPFRSGLDFGTHYRQEGWGQGLTMHTCFMNMMPHLAPEDRSRALYHGLAAVASDCAGTPPRFAVQPLPGARTDLVALKRWFRRSVEVRDAEGAERCIVTAVRVGADDRQLADMLFAAATDHTYIQTGHVLDFTNKALEALDHVGWQNRETVEQVLSSLAMSYATADRAEESNAWRHPVDLIQMLDDTFADVTGLRYSPDLPYRRCGSLEGTLRDLSGLDRQKLVPILLSDNPQAIASAPLSLLREGYAPEELAAAVAYAAALRIARFHTSNEFGDWDTALHTFTFANAVHQGLRRVQSTELVCGIFDAAMSVYLDRFLNIPPARLPETNGAIIDPASLLDELATLLNQQQQVDAAGELTARYLCGGGDPGKLMAMLGKLLLREDRDFHTIQCTEAAFRQFGLTRSQPDSTHILVAAARYLAAHSPTMRAQGQTYHIAQRLSRGEKLFEA